MNQPCTGVLYLIGVGYLAICGVLVLRHQAVGAGESLDVLARALSDESRHQQEAAQEVEALLA